MGRYRRYTALSLLLVTAFYLVYRLLEIFHLQPLFRLSVLRPLVTLLGSSLVTALFSIASHNRSADSMTPASPYIGQIRCLVRDRNEANGGSAHA